MGEASGRGKTPGGGPIRTGPRRKRDLDSATWRWWVEEVHLQPVAIF